MHAIARWFQNEDGLYARVSDRVAYGSVRNALIVWAIYFLQMIATGICILMSWNTAGTILFIINLLYAVFLVFVLNKRKAVRSDYEEF